MVVNALTDFHSLLTLLLCKSIWMCVIYIRYSGVRYIGVGVKLNLTCICRNSFPMAWVVVDACFCVSNVFVEIVSISRYVTGIIE